MIIFTPDYATPKNNWLIVPLKTNPKTVIYDKPCIIPYFINATSASINQLKTLRHINDLHPYLYMLL